MNLDEQLLAMIPPPIVGAAVRQAGYRNSWMWDHHEQAYVATKNIWDRTDITNNELQFYTSGGNVAFDDREIIITPALNTEDIGEIGQPYTSGLLSNRNNYSQTYGKFEIEATLPIGKGVWPAFWMLPEFATWPEEFSDRILPEIDIMEYIGDNPSRYYSTLHYYENQDQQRDNYTHFCPEHDLTQSRHRYGLEWTPTFMAWYFDGRYRKVIPTPANFHVPYHMIVNLAIGGNWPGTPELPEDLSTVKFQIHDWTASESVPLEDHPNYDLLKRLLEIKKAANDCHYQARLDGYINELVA